MKLRIFIPMNTLIYENVISGADIFVIELAKRLMDRFEICVMTTDVGKRLWLDSVPNLKELHVIPSFTKSCPPFLISLVLMLRTIAACLRIRHVDKYEGRLLFYTPSDYLCDILPAVYMKRKDKKCIWISRIHHVILPFWRRRGNPLLNLLSFVGQRISIIIIRQISDLTLTLSGTYEELVKLNFRNKLAILDPGVDLETIDSIPRSSKKECDAIFVGRLHPTKGVYDLLEIWKYVVREREDAKLAIIGGGQKNIVNSLKNLIKRYALQKNVEVLGFIPNSTKVYKFLKSSKIYIIAEHENGWSMSGAEAMACSLPIVAWDNLKMFKFAFSKGFVLVPFRDFKAFAESIIDLLENDRKRLELSNEARREAKLFDWNKRAEQLSNYISQLLHRSWQV
jgi:glycosyltransferase involved in cell wall biosynthesis